MTSTWDGMALTDSHGNTASMAEESSQGRKKRENQPSSELIVEMKRLRRDIDRADSESREKLRSRVREIEATLRERGHL